MFFPTFALFGCYFHRYIAQKLLNGPDPGTGAKPSMVRPMEPPVPAFPGILGGLIYDYISHRPVKTVSHAVCLVFAYHSVACIDKRLCAAIIRKSSKK